MQLTNHKANKNFDTGSKSNLKKYSAISPNQEYSYFDTPTIEKPPIVLNISRDNQDLIKTTEQKMQRSPIQPLMYGAQTPPYPFINAIDIDNIMMEHRSEIQDLLSELRRLQDLLYESQQLRSQQIHKIKQQYQTTNFLQMSNFRQNHNSQSQFLQAQIRKLKQQLQQKSEEHKKLQTQLARERFSNESQKQILKQEVKQLIEKKNYQIYELKQENECKYRRFQQQKDGQLTQLRYKTDKQIAHLNKAIQDKSGQLQKILNQAHLQYNQKNKTIERLSSQKAQIEDRYELRIKQLYHRYQTIKNNFNQTLSKNIQSQQNNWSNLHKMFKNEYQSLFNLLKNRQHQIKQKNLQIQILLQCNNGQFERILQQNTQLKHKIKQIYQQNNKQIQLLKVKIALLHQNDIKKLKQLYDLKLQNNLICIKRLDQDNNQLKKLVHQVKNQRYQMKRKHQNTVSELQSRIIKLKMGASAIQNDYKEKLQNEKSLMLMTSKSFMKQAQVKNTNHRFYEEEIRKLRQLMELQSKQNEHSEKAVEEKIMAANNQLERLSNKIIHIAKEKQQLQQSLQHSNKEKDQQIARLRAEILKLSFPNGQSMQKQINILQQLRADRNKKREENEILADKVALMQSKIKEMQAEVERFQMQNQMIHEEGKKQFHEISESHLSQFKIFYEDKLRRLEDQKNELKKIINSQTQQITQLIKKYKQIEQGMKQAVLIVKKRTALEEKVINLGMDNNLIKNLSEMLPSHLRNIKN